MPSYPVDKDYPAGPEIMKSNNFSLNEAIDMAENYPVQWRLVSV